MKHRPLEAQFQRRVMAKLKTLPLTWVYKASDKIRSGIPDILMCFKGRFVALELKRDSKSKASPLQAHTIDLIRKAGGEACVVTPENWDEVWEKLCNFANGDQ